MFCPQILAQITALSLFLVTPSKRFAPIFFGLICFLKKNRGASKLKKLYQGSGALIYLSADMSCKKSVQILVLIFMVAFLTEP